MLSYQHIYHAGNTADVHKHSVLSIVLTTLLLKPKPISYMETHAGRGFYNLQSAEAIKTGEAQTGILHYLRKKQKLLPTTYLDVIDKIHHELGEDFYAGSPLLARLLLKGSSNVFNLMELHPQEYDFLRTVMRNFRGVHCHKRDGYEGVLAISPPRASEPRRGFVLIDPSYEEKSEYEKVSDFIYKLHRKWPETVIMLWYPILSANMHILIREKLQQGNLEKLIISEVLFPQSEKEGLLGSGVAIINTPYAALQDIENFTDKFRQDLLP